MRFILSNFFILLFFISSPVYAESFYKEFSIKVSGLKIGELVWVLEIDNNNYSNDIKLKSKGFLSAIYTFEGNYFSKGIVANNKLKPNTYNHIWKTNKTKKTMSLSFENNTLSSLNQTPYEKEKLRIDVFNIKQTKDPLSSFLEIIMGENSSLVVDGRRIYTMSAKFNKKENKNVINISDYSNLWADHKRSKFEQISFEKKDGVLLPKKIIIHFDGRVFKLEEN
ncbi:DUF3108 domain-containing protein [Alphaproteobacteria bacterium]|nr:DUF3108 domain-containing protein [Alphaproteobacteria bacterium]